MRLLFSRLSEGEQVYGLRRLRSCGTPIPEPQRGSGSEVRQIGIGSSAN